MQEEIIYYQIENSDGKFYLGVQNLSTYGQDSNIVYNVTDNEYCYKKNLPGEVQYKNVYLYLLKYVETPKVGFTLSVKNEIIKEKTNNILIATNNNYVTPEITRLDDESLTILLTMLNHFSKKDNVDTPKQEDAMTVENNKELEYRMYGFVPYNISDIQKGIQFGHGVVEYQLLHGHTELYSKWAREYKTFIILNGGTTNDDNGTINNYFEELTICAPNLRKAVFREPDLNYAMTSFVFIVDERVWNEEKYPFDLDNNYTEDEILDVFGDDYDEVLQLRMFLKTKKLA